MLHLSPRSRVIALPVAIAAGWLAAATLEQLDLIDFTSISASGTNLTLRAEVPAGLAQVRLEVKPALDGEWRTQGVQSVTALAGPVEFTLPKPEVGNAFFRLIAMPAPGAAAAPVVKASAQKGSAAAGELGYVTIPAVAPPGAQEGVLHIQGVIDGSDRMVITREGVLWNHVNWDWPRDAVTANGVRWNPREKNFVTTRGQDLLIPASLSLDQVTLETVTGRDVIALERTTNGLVAIINDTWQGSAPYEFRIHFHAAPPEAARPASSPAGRLKIAGQIDGSDVFRIRASGAEWKHRSMKPPTALTFNDVAWAPGPTNAVLRNEGATAFLPAGVDLSTARIVARRGRDLATLWAEQDSVLVTFADNPNGSDHYELEIAFGP